MGVILPSGNDSEARRIANGMISTPAARSIAEIVARELGVPPGARYNSLRMHLAYAYAQGFLRGWADARRLRGDRPPVPTEGNQ
jgi:hypothetical protein